MARDTDETIPKYTPDVVKQDVYALRDIDKPVQTRTVPELPAINNLRREQTAVEDSPRHSPFSPVTPQRKIESGSEALRRNFDLERTNSSSKLSVSSKAKPTVLSKVQPLARFPPKDPVPVQIEFSNGDDSGSDSDVPLDDEITGEIPEDAGETTVAFTDYADYPDNSVINVNSIPTHRDAMEDEHLGIIDLDLLDLPDRPLSADKFKQKIAKPNRSKTNFNRLTKAEPIMPLRHNITSVLRQERLQNERNRYEASQHKVKKYVDKLKGNSSLSKLHVRDAASAISRKSSIAKK